jgi:hypothetical protein
MKIFIGSVCAAAALVSGAEAQNGQLSSTAAPVTNPTSTVSDFNVRSLGPILNELGVTWEAYEADNGQPFINANFAGAINFRLIPSACRESGFQKCTGLSLIAGFSGKANAQTVNAFNFRYAFASAGLDPSGSAYLSRYEISDYGVARGNVATSILVFIQQAAYFSDELASARQTVSLEGYADDLAASKLNRQVREEITGAKTVAANPIELHQQSLEEMAEHVRHFVSDKSAPKNKINNIGKQ